MHQLIGQIWRFIADAGRQRPGCVMPRWLLVRLRTAAFRSQRSNKPSGSGKLTRVQAARTNNAYGPTVPSNVGAASQPPPIEMAAPTARKGLCASHVSVRFQKRTVGKTPSVCGRESKSGLSRPSAQVVMDTCRYCASACGKHRAQLMHDAP